MPPMFTCKWCFNNDYRNSMLYIWHMPLHFILWHAIKLLQPINQNQSITSLFVTCHKYLLQPIKSIAQIWVVNIISMEFLHFLKSYLEGGLLSGGIMKCRFFSQAIKVICSTCMLFFFFRKCSHSVQTRELLQNKPFNMSILRSFMMVIRKTHKAVVQTYPTKRKIPLLSEPMRVAMYNIAVTLQCPFNTVWVHCKKYIA